MNQYLFYVKKEISYAVTITAQDEHQALILIESGMSVDSCEEMGVEVTYKPPKLLGGMDGQ